MLQTDKPIVPDSLETLARVWETREPQHWAGRGDYYLEFGKKAVALGQPTLAFDILREGMALFPDHGEMQYLSSLALAKSGATGHAASLLDGLLSNLSHSDPLCSDAMSLAGRIAKDRWCKLPDGPPRQEAGERARTWYRRAYELSRHYFPGINAATMSVLTGHVEEGKRIAREVRDLCLVAKSSVNSNDYWLHATLGESFLLLGQEEEAVRCYSQAAGLAEKNFGDIASMRRQLKLLGGQVPTASKVLQTLVIPRVVTFTGHMMDAPDRLEPRFPAEIEGAVEKAIAAALDEIDTGFGYCPAACGADIVFIEQMLRREAEVNIVLPFRRDDFLRTSVAFAGDRWVERFDRTLSRATSVHYCVEEGYLGDDILFDYAGILTHGMALLRAEQLEIDPMLLAVLEPGAEQKVGGTLANLRHWQQHGRPALVLNLREIRNQALAGWGANQTARRPDRAIVAESTALPPRSESSWGRRQIKTMLFADMVGFSRLAEQDAPSFFVYFLGEVAKEIKASAVKPAFWNTWGDGLYLVFDDILVAADFGLRLRDAVVQTDWEKVGLPKGISIRIGMHTGPVFPAFDPIIMRNNFFGSHVNRAARIEPITAPGSVYVTEQMASMLAASGNKDFACDYLGTLALAKKFGSSRIYRLRRTWETE